MKKRLSSLAHGDNVVLTQDCKALHYGDRVFKAGEIGRLGRLYRIQDDLEIWEVVFDQPGYVFIAVAHTQMEKVEG